MKYNLSTEDQSWAQETYEKLQKKLGAECARIGSKIPYYLDEGGHYIDVEDDPKLDICWWTNGFWGGLLWQMYHATKDESYRKAAVGVEERLDKALENYVGLHHDVGFMWLHTAVADYRLTGSEDAKRRGLHAANLLAGRYNPAGKFIRAWNEDKTGWIIVDCMMNIPILYWASEMTGDPRFRTVAQNHADTCMRITVRGDGSCNHISVLNPENGELIENPAGQGAESGSSWSRGQGWAIYGFSLSARHTGRADYLEAAKRVAHYFIANVSLTGWLPLIDFRAPDKGIDTTAAGIAACGMLEIASQAPEAEKALYQSAAMQILRAVERECCDWDPEKDSVVQHGSVAYHAGKPDIDMPIIYGDYFFTEAVLRLLDKDFLIW